MDRSKMSFCPHLGERLNVQAMSRFLADQVFGNKDFAGLLKARYDQMGNLFRDAHYDDPRWNLEEFDSENRATTKKKDARLKVPQDKVGSANPHVTELFGYDNFGHDMPAWVTYSHAPAARRVMIVSQDPLRSEDGSGFLYLSTPFGIHSPDFERGGMDARVRDMLETFLEAGHLVYMTDYMKFFAKETGFIKKQLGGKSHDPHGFWTLFSDAFNKEVAAFSPRLDYRAWV